MLLRIFKGTGPGVILLITLILILVWIGAIIHHNAAAAYVYEIEPMPLYGLLKGLFGENHFLGIFFSLSVVSIVSFQLVNFNTSVFFINERTFLPAFIYILFGGLFPQLQVLNPVLPASVFLMLALKRIMDGYRETGVGYNFFDAGLLISTGSLFYGNLIWFGLLVIIGILVLRAFNLMEILVTIFGLITPYLLTFSVYYVMGKDMESLILLIEKNLFGKSSFYSFQPVTIIALVISGLIILVSLMQLMTMINTKKIKSRKTFSLLLWMFIISLGIYFILPSVSVEIAWITIIPVSYFFTHYFVFVRRKLVGEIFFGMLVVIITLVQIWYLK